MAYPLRELVVGQQLRAQLQQTGGQLRLGGGERRLGARAAVSMTVPEASTKVSDDTVW